MPSPRPRRPAFAAVHTLEPRTLFTFPAEYAGQFVSDGDINVIGVAADTTGNVYVTGTFANTADFNLSPRRVTQLAATAGLAFVARYTPDGALDWVHQFGGGGGSAIPRGISVDPWGSALLAGEFRGTTDLDPDPDAFNDVTASGSGTDVFAIKLAASGQTRFINVLTTVEDDSVVDTAVTDLGEFVIAGKFARAGFADRGFVARFTGNGKGRYLAKFGDGALAANLTALAVDPDRNIFVAGLADAGVDLDPNDTATAPLAAESHFLLKLDPTGAYQWTAPLAPAGVYLAHLATDASGNLFAAGTYSGSFDFNPSPPPRQRHDQRRLPRRLPRQVHPRRRDRLRPQYGRRCGRQRQRPRHRPRHRRRRRHRHVQRQGLLQPRFQRLPPDHGRQQDRRIRRPLLERRPLPRRRPHRHRRRR